MNLKLDRFHCLRETSGSIPVVSGMTGGDEVQFRLAYSTASGADDEIGCSATVEDVDSGEGLSLSDPLVLHAPGDPGEHLDIKVTGYEVDVTWGVETGRVTLGPGTRRLQRAALLWLTRNGAIHVASPVLCGDDGEYVAKVEVTL